MQQALDQFDRNIARARSLAGLSTSLSHLTTPAVDTTDLLRAALVLSVSALDHFVHEFARIGMIEIHRNGRSAPPAHLQFKVTLAAVREAQLEVSGTGWLDQAVRKAHRWLSFQDPDKLADAVRLISPVNLWECVARELTSDVATTKAKLRAIVDRRNKIAHEADMDPTNPGERWPIDDALVASAIDFIESMVRAIHKVAWAPANNGMHTGGNSAALHSRR